MSKSKIKDTHKTAGKNHTKNIDELLIENIEAIEKVCHDPTSSDRIPTGFADIDECLAGGFGRGEFIVIGSRPSVGKSSFLRTVLLNMAIKTRIPALVFTPETLGKKFSLLLLSNIARIDIQKMVSGDLLDDDWPRITTAITILSETNLTIKDIPYLTLDQIIEESKVFCSNNPHGIIFLDCVQLVKVPGYTGNSIYEETSIVARELKKLANHLDTTIVVTSQLNRRLEERFDRRPLIRDLRDSGHLEDVADIVILIYRDEIYNPATKDEGIAEINIAKHRYGPTDIIRLLFLAAYGCCEPFHELS